MEVHGLGVGATFKCPCCNFSSQRVTNARNHVAACLRIWRIRSCPGCHLRLPASSGVASSMPTVSTLRQHLKWHSGQPAVIAALSSIGVLCRICGAESNAPLAPLMLELHMALHSFKVRVRCAECALYLPRDWATLHHHYQRVHPRVCDQLYVGLFISQTDQLGVSD